MSTFYIDLLSIFFLFLTSLTCLFALFGRYGLYWVLPWLASTILALIRFFRLFAPDASYQVVEGTDFYIAMLTPVAILILFLSSLLLRYGINRHADARREDEYEVVSIRRASAGPTLRSAPEEPHVDTEGIFSRVSAGIPALPETIHTRFVFVLGIKHSGKSTLGRLAAGELSLPFFDLDELILDLFRGTELEKTGIRQLYTLFGRQRFLQLEYLALVNFFAFSEASHVPGLDELMVISLGGGACDNERLVGLMQSTGVMVYLYLPEQVLFKRIEQGGIPPFLDKSNPRESFHRLFLGRDSIYRSIADILIPLSAEHQPPENARLLAGKIREIQGAEYGKQHIRKTRQPDNLR